MAAIQLPNSNGLSTTFFGSSVKTQSSQFVCVQMPSKAGYPSVLCGRGDKRTAKGKRFRHSHGNSRPKNSSKGRGLPPTPLPARTTPKKDAAGTEDLIEIKLGD